MSGIRAGMRHFNNMRDKPLQPRNERLFNSNSWHKTHERVTVRPDAWAHALPDANFNMLRPFLNVLDKGFFGQMLLANWAHKTGGGADISRMGRKSLGRC